MIFTVYQATHTGARPRNEDRVGHTHTSQALLLVLADGMGGHPQGDRAAEIAVRTFVRAFLDQAQPRLADPRAFLERTVRAASQAIVDFAQAHALVEHPRTTVVVAVVQQGQMTALHSGDSRLYWARDGWLLQRTRDHSYHDQPALFGALPAGVHRGVLFTCLGSDADPLYDVLGPAPLASGDRILLCSDGLWSVFDDDTLAAALYAAPLADAVERLAQQALQRGGRHGDNVTLLAMEWLGEDDFPSTQVLEPAEAARLAAAGAPAADLDELEIERTIAEINDAIRRTRRTPAPSTPSRRRPPVR